MRQVEADLGDFSAVDVIRVLHSVCLNQDGTATYFAVALCSKPKSWIVGGEPTRCVTPGVTNNLNQSHSPYSSEKRGKHI